METTVKAREWIDKAEESAMTPIEPMRQLYGYWSGEDGWSGVESSGPRGGLRQYEAGYKRCWRERTDELLKALGDANQDPQYNPETVALRALRSVLDLIDEGEAAPGFGDLRSPGPEGAHGRGYLLALHEVRTVIADVLNTD